MMKMSGGVTSCCVALLLALTSVSAVPKELDSIDDLKEIDFGSSVPAHSLVLLRGFADIVDLDSNNVIWLNFDPNRGDYGSHHYHNNEGMLNPLPQGHQYYTIGNLLRDTASNTEQLPSYVHNFSREYEGNNRYRIIFRVQSRRSGGLHRVDQVYITQHYDPNEHRGTSYDPDHTYQITNRLLRQIREFSAQPLSYLRNHYGGNIDDVEFNDIRDTWGNLASLGLLLFIVTGVRYSCNQRNNSPENSNSSEDNNEQENNNSLEELNMLIDNSSEDNNVRRPYNNRSENTDCPSSCPVICCVSVCVLVPIILLMIGLLLYLLKQ